MKKTQTRLSSVAATGLVACIVSIMTWSAVVRADTPSLDLKIEQVTFGPEHHFFGYIGQCRTIPWNASGRYILGMEITSIDRMPKPEEAAVIFLVDTGASTNISS